MSETRVSGERLAELTTSSGCWLIHREGDQCIYCDALQMAPELRSQRQLLKRMAAALEVAQELIDSSDYPRTLEAICAVLAEYREAVK